MALSIYDIAVPSFQQMLSALSGVLDKAAAHCKDKKIEETALTTARLFPDMFPFARQVQQATQHAANSTANLAGMKPPTLPDAGTSFESLKERVTKTLEFLGSVKREQMENAEAKDLEIMRGGNPVIFSGRNYLLCFIFPNFYFHVTTAYDILRSNGIEVGKKDFTGAFQPK